MPTYISDAQREAIGNLTSTAEACVDSWRLREITEDACNARLDELRNLTRDIRLGRVPPEVPVLPSTVVEGDAQSA